jgi:glucosylceramidase
LDPSCTFQEILGFGAALTDAACYLLHQLSPSKRQEFLREVFDPAATGLNTCRICIGSSDYATAPYSYDEGDPDPEMERFSIDHDRQYILPILQEVQRFCPDLFLLASPWSPPGWMKVGGSMLGGSIQRKHFPAYAKYFLKFVESYAAAGVPIHAITVQNEVDTDQEGLMPACLWGQVSEVRFVAEHLGPCFAEQGIKSKIWIIDHNYDLWGRALCELADPEVNKFVDGIAWHGYAGKPDAMTLVRSEHPDKHMYWTEGGPEDLNDPRLQTNWAQWGSKFTEILHNWARCIIAWNIALDENGKPNIGPFRCAGLVTVDSQTKQITPSGQYWALAHYSRSVRRGARRIQSQGTLPGISHVAFRNPGEDYAMVLTNTGAAETVSIGMVDWEIQIDLPADSIATLTWSNEIRGEE